MEKKPKQKQTREAARIASLTKKVEKLKEYNEGYQQLLRCMDAILYEIGIKYGERIVGADDSPEGSPGVWEMEIPVPEPERIKKGQVVTERGEAGYRITLKTKHFLNNPLTAE